jgi:hypothetical protein
MEDPPAPRQAAGTPPRYASLRLRTALVSAVATHTQSSVSCLLSDGARSVVDVPLLIPLNTGGEGSL